MSGKPRCLQVSQTCPTHPRSPVGRRGGTRARLDFSWSQFLPPSLCPPPTHTHTADRSLGRRSLVLSFFYLNVLARPWPKGHTASGRPRPSRGSRSAGPIGRRPPGWAPAGRAGARQRLLRARGHPHPPLSWCPPRRPSSLRSQKGHLAAPWGQPCPLLARRSARRPLDAALGASPHCPGPASGSRLSDGSYPAAAAVGFPAPCTRGCRLPRAARGVSFQRGPAPRTAGFPRLAARGGAPCRGRSAVSPLPRAPHLGVSVGAPSPCCPEAGSAEAVGRASGAGAARQLLPPRDLARLCVRLCPR